MVMINTEQNTLNRILKACSGALVCYTEALHSKDRNESDAELLEVYAEALTYDISIILLNKELSGD